MTDIDQMSGNINQPETEGKMSVITGFAPAATIGDYINTVNEYTHGTGTLSLDYKGYGPCHNSEEIIAEKPMTVRQILQILQVRFFVRMVQDLLFRGIRLNNICM